MAVIFNSQNKSEIKGRKKEKFNDETIRRLMEFYEPFIDDLIRLFPDFEHQWDLEI